MAKKGKAKKVVSARQPQRVGVALLKKDGTIDRRFSFTKYLKKDGRPKKGQEQKAKQAFREYLKKVKKVKIRGGIETIISPQRLENKFLKSVELGFKPFIQFDGKNIPLTFDDFDTLLTDLSQDYFEEVETETSPQLIFLVSITRKETMLGNRTTISDRKFVWLYQQSEAQGMPDYDFEFYYFKHINK